MNIGVFSTGIFKLGLILKDLSTSTNGGCWKANNHSLVNPQRNSDCFKMTPPIEKWKDRIQDFQFQSKNAHLPYFMRSNPWLKENKYFKPVSTHQDDNFLTVSKTLYELCGHNAIFN